MHHNRSCHGFYYTCNDQQRICALLMQCYSICGSYTCYNSVPSLTFNSSACNNSSYCFARQAAPALALALGLPGPEAPCAGAARDGGEGSGAGAALLRPTNCIVHLSAQEDGHVSYAPNVQNGVAGALQAWRLLRLQAPGARVRRNSTHPSMNVLPRIFRTVYF